MVWRNLKNLSRGKRFIVGGSSALAVTGSAYYFYNERSNLRKISSELDPLRQTGPNKFQHYPNAAIALDNSGATEIDRQLHSLWSPPTREELIEKMKQSAKDPSQEFDLLVVGGGATGAGVALDAASRGLKVALVERDDYSAGTSSRSTKLVHGGVRYLEKAFMNLDYEQYKLVVEALHERSIFLTTAPHLSQQLPIMLPIYRWWQVPYFWAGSKVYDILSGAEKLQSSYFLTRGKALEAFPMLKKDSLVGAMVYYDGQHNDSRMNIALILTAIFHGAVASNHTEVISLIKESDGNSKQVIRGAVVKDTLTGESFKIKAKGVINATGPFTDGLRKMDVNEAENIVAPSAGVHIVLPNYYSPEKMGLLDPSTSDGRVIFFLPWQGNVVAGTTDTPTSVTADPLPQEEEITWILDEIRRYLSPEINVRRGDVLAAWSGIRPLVRDPSAKSTEGLVRNHMINVSENKLLTIAGGKWTTYRAMAEETVDRAIQEYGLKPSKPCITESLKLIGAHGFSQNMFIKLIQHFGLETEVARHLASTYGDRAWGVVSLSEVTGQRWPLFGKRLSASYPYIEAEVRYAVHNEYALTAADVLARRTRLSFLNAHATLEALPRVISIMTAELGWDSARQAKEYTDTLKFLESMGLPKDLVQSTLDAPKANHFDPAFSRAQFYPLELAQYRDAFSQKDTDKDGHITLNDLQQVVATAGFPEVSASDLSNALNQVGLGNTTSSVEFYEFLELLSVLKNVEAGPSKLSRAPLNKFTTDRSGGGV